MLSKSKSGFKRDLRSTEFNQISGTVVKQLWVILTLFVKPRYTIDFAVKLWYNKTHEIITKQLQIQR